MLSSMIFNEINLTVCIFGGSIKYVITNVMWCNHSKYTLMKNQNANSNKFMKGIINILNCVNLTVINSINFITVINEFYLTGLVKS